MTVRVVTFDDNVSSTVSPTDANLTRTVMVNGTDVTDPNFIDSSTVTFIVSGSNISLTSSGGGGTGGGHVIENAAGDDLAQRANLQFVGATVSDDAANDRTIVEVTQGERIVIGEDQFKVETSSGATFDPPRTETGEVGDAVDFISLVSTSILFRDMNATHLAYNGTNGLTISLTTDGSIINEFIASTGNAPSVMHLTSTDIYWSRTEFSPSRQVISHNTIISGGSIIEDFSVETSGSIGGIALIGSDIYYTFTDGSTNQIRRVLTTTTSELIFTLPASTTYLRMNGTRLYYVVSNSLRSINPSDATPTEVNHTSTIQGSAISLINGIIYGYSLSSVTGFTLQTYNISTDTSSTIPFAANVASNTASVTGDYQQFNFGVWGEISSTRAISAGLLFGTSIRRAFTWSPNILEYTQTLALPNVTINTDTDKYVYTNPFASVGTFTVAFNDPTPTAITTAALTLELNNTPAIPTAGTVRFSQVSGNDFIIFNTTDLPNLFNEDSIITLKTGVTGRVNFVTQNPFYIFTFITGSIGDLTNGETLTITGFSGNQVPASDVIRIGANSTGQEFLGFNLSVPLLATGDMIRLKGGVVATITTVSAVITGAIYYLILMSKPLS